MRRVLLLVMVLGVLCSSASGAPKKAGRKKDDWLAPNKIRETVKKAAEKDFAFVILVQSRKSSNPLHEAQVKMFEKNGTVRRMAKARAYADRASREVMLLRGQVPYKRYIPYLMFTDGEGHLIGYVPYEGNQRDVSAQAGQAKATMVWKKKARAKLDGVDKMISDKKYNQARSELDEVETQDKVRTGKIKWSIAKMCRKTPRPKPKEQESDQDDHGARSPPHGGAGPQLEGLAESGQEDAEKPKKLPKKPRPAESAELLAGRIDQCRQALQLAIDDDLTMARILHAQARPRAAMKALEPLLAVEGDQQWKKKVAQLKAELDEAIKAVGAEPQPAEPAVVPNDSDR